MPNQSWKKDDEIDLFAGEREGLTVPLVETLLALVGLVLCSKSRTGPVGVHTMVLTGGTV